MVFFLLKTSLVTWRKNTVASIGKSGRNFPDGFSVQVKIGIPIGMSETAGIDKKRV